MQRWVENVVNATIDIAKIVIASEKKKIPQTYRQIVENLNQVDGFDKNTVEGIANFTKLRNILAHEYIDIRFNRIKGFISEAKILYNKFIEMAMRYIESQEEDSNEEKENQGH